MSIRSKEFRSFEASSKKAGAMPVTGTEHGATPSQSASSNQGETAPDSVDLYDSFDSMGLSEHLLRGIYSYGWEQPYCHSTASHRPSHPGTRSHRTSFCWP